MTTDIDALKLRRSLNRGCDGVTWCAPVPFGPNGWRLVDEWGKRSVVVSCSDYGDTDWVHASMSGATAVPSYADLTVLHEAVWGDGWAYQVFTPPAEHVNIHEHALHLFGRLDGKPALPDFTRGTGSI